MLPGHHGRIIVQQQGGLNPLVAIGGDAHADTRGADEQTHIRSTREDALGHGFGVVRIVNPVIAVGADVFHRVAFGAKRFNQSILQHQAAMIGAGDDSF